MRPKETGNETVSDRIVRGVQAGLKTRLYDLRFDFHQARRFVISFSNPKSVGL
jgi:hypothetical protein